MLMSTMPIPHDLQDPAQAAAEEDAALAQVGQLLREEIAAMAAGGSSDGADAPDAAAHAPRGAA